MWIQHVFFKHALLSILLYDEVLNQHRRNPNKYEEWEGEFNFGDLDIDNITITDISKIERLNNLKFTAHVWEGKSYHTLQ